MNWKRRSLFWSRINYLWFIGFLIDVNFPTRRIVALPLLYNYESISITKVSSTFYSIILPHKYKNTFIYFKNVADWRFRLTLKTYLKCNDTSIFMVESWKDIVRVWTEICWKQKIENIFVIKLKKLCPDIDLRPVGYSAWVS